ncbi:uncharacterized protein LOC100169409 [Acyrthosiphon pisum]|uniref:Uncharacterized protein n=1 Tax=Acyrthosiphon pisum TaxID=7029 RepID=A0A8R2F7L2_ACYPI|nr:uncharacterized protein LOC100169409 [Acyrthosiphon pisum]|eukprot:XP_008182307.1 PREDICTED: uncharacterized protein LOC100169409 [Acyrthosiphon pisum]
MRFASCAVLALLPFCLHAAVVMSGDSDNYLQQEQKPVESTGNGNWAMVTRMADECAKDADTAACVAVKAAAALERAARATGPVQVLPGLTVMKNTDEGSSSQRDSRALPTEDELRGQLQQQPSKVTDMVVNSAIRFLQSRTLQLKFPQTNPEELSRAIEEGRGKLKKKMLPILGFLAVKIVAVLPILLGIIGFFALKALVFGKLALLIAGVMAFQKYASASGGFGKIADTWSAGNVQAAPWSAPAAPSTNGGGYYRRSMEAQQMAYNGQVQPSAQAVA